MAGLPGRAAAAGTLPETRRLIKEAVQLYVQALRENGQPVPEPSATADSVAVAG